MSVHSHTIQNTFIALLIGICVIYYLTGEENRSEEDIRLSEADTVILVIIKTILADILRSHI